MSKKAVYLTILVAVLTGVLGVSTNVHKVEAPYPIIHIRADGSIDPPTVNITSPDNVTYTFTADINASIIVERNNIIVDGAGYTLQGTGGGIGIDLTGRSNVTIKNMTIKEFYEGILLYAYSLNNTISGNAITTNEFGIYFDSSSNNTISGNNITNNMDGIWLYESSNNTISGNGITTNNYTGIYFEGPSSNNIVSGNNIRNNSDGIYLEFSINNIISGNSITENNGTGIYLYESSNNTITGNTETENNVGINLYLSLNNTIPRNNVVANKEEGIYLEWYSNYNSIHGNNVTANYDDGIDLDDSSNNTIFENYVAANKENGINLERSSNNTIYGNIVINNNVFGIELDSSLSNTIYHNYFINNTWPAWISPGNANIWDDGAGKGNYWSDYEERYPNATEIDGSGIWDTPYVIDENNQDNYPIVPEFPSFLILPFFMIATLLAVIVYRRKHS